MPFGYSTIVFVNGCDLPVKLIFILLSNVPYILYLFSSLSRFSLTPVACGYYTLLQSHLQNPPVFSSAVSHDLFKWPRKLCRLSRSRPMSAPEGPKADFPTSPTFPHLWLIAARYLVLVEPFVVLKSTRKLKPPSAQWEARRLRIICVGPFLATSLWLYFLRAIRVLGHVIRRMCPTS